MSLNCTLENGICIVMLTEEFVEMGDDAIDDIQQMVDIHLVKAVLLDMEKVPSLDSAGIGKIMLLFKDLKELKIPMAICHVSQKNRKVLKITQVEMLFPIYSTKVEAVESLQESHSFES